MALSCVAFQRCCMRTGQVQCDPEPSNSATPTPVSSHFQIKRQAR
ncbi:rCG48546 [Rattus norvegicus]|uniref:RCG48546 n=1 Tax=Rattus norvegicus TaxID=10116 RepID=A6HWY4_RAT|nr:rCG48546 [Rattus norvegicus]